MARGIGAILFSVAIGLPISAIKDEKIQDKGNFMIPAEESEHSKPKYIGLVFFLSLLGILIFGAVQMWIYEGISPAAIIGILFIGFKKGEIKD